MLERVASVPRAIRATPLPALRAAPARTKLHASTTRPVRTDKASLMQGSHGPSHHPRAWAKFRTFCSKAVYPLIHLADKGIAKILHHDRFTSSYMPTSLGNLHVLTTPGRGTLPPVVLLHGLSSSASEYSTVLHKLKKVSRQVIALDMPGHGKSVDFKHITAGQFIGAVTEALDKLVSTPVVLMGHSLGAYTAAHYASARPGKIKALVLLAPPGGPVSQRRRCDTVRLFEADSFHDAVYVTARAFPRNWLVWPILGATMQERLLRGSLQVLIHSDMDQMFLPQELLRNMKPPTMVFWADKERLIPLSTLPYLQKNLPAATTKFQIIRRQGHSELGMMPKRVMRPFVRFVSELK